MAIAQLRVIDAGGRKPYTNAAPSTANGEMVVHEQLAAALEGVGWKDNARVASVANVTISAPGAAIDGITMALNDRVVLKNQTSQPENGIYIWSGAAAAMTRSLDASTFDELESAVITIDEGTNAGTTWRQTQVNGTIGTTNVVWATFGSGAAPASETVSGIAELATQAETDAGTDDARIITPLKHKTSSLRAKGFSANIGDGSATSIAVTHNLNTTDVQVTVRELTGTLREVIAEVQYTGANVVTLLFDAAPAANALRVNVGTLPA
jgi:hypothetical protein